MMMMTTTRIIRNDNDKDGHASAYDEGDDEARGWVSFTGVRGLVRPPAPFACAVLSRCVRARRSVLAVPGVPDSSGLSEETLAEIAKLQVITHLAGDARWRLN